MADLAVIENFNTGIGPDSFTGNGEISGVEIDKRPGVVRIGLETIRTGTAIFTQAEDIHSLAANFAMAGQVWAMDSARNIYRGTANVEPAVWSTTVVSGSYGDVGASRGGLVVWKDYSFFTTNTGNVNTDDLIAYGPLSTGSARVYNITTVTSQNGLDVDANYHPFFVGQDDILYGGAGRYVFSLQGISGTTFAAGTAATFTYTPRALDLPQGYSYKVRCLSEIGSKLMIGTWAGGTNITIDTARKIGDIFPWDRISDSFTLPIKTGERGIHAMITTNNLTYFIAGTEIKLMVTNGTNVQELARIPQHIVDLSDGTNLEVRPNAMIYHNGKILFGLSAATGAGLGAYGQVWSYNLTTGALQIENTIQNGSNGEIASLLSTDDDRYLIGVNAGQGQETVEQVQRNVRYSSYGSAFVTSPYLSLGSKSSPANVSEIEVQFARPLASGQGVRLSYRTNLSADFTLVSGGTVDFADYGAIQEEIVPFKLEVPNGVQIRAGLITSAGGSTSPELRRIILR